MKYIPLALLLFCCAFFSCETQKEEFLESSSLSTLRIITESGNTVTSKDEYQSAFLTIEGQLPFEGKVGIRGRGNTTWSFPKKPFKIKFEEKESLLGLKPGKKWVLLANYLDPSLMHNAVAMKLGYYLGLPFTNNIIPVDLWLNNELLGSYTLTEQVEVKGERVDIGDDGLLLSLDTIIEEDDIWFESSVYQLPVQVKNPEPNSQELELIKRDFAELEDLINADEFPKNNYLDFFEAESMAKYLLLYTLTCNEEINHPKSTYIYKKPKGKYTIGPIWDFDWAFSYEQSRVHYVNPERPLFWTNGAKGKRFFKRIADDPAIRIMMKKEWESFRSENFGNLISFVDDYADSIEASRKADFRKWGRGNTNFSIEVEALKDWLIKRANYMDKMINDV